MNPSIFLGRLTSLISKLKKSLKIRKPLIKKKPLLDKKPLFRKKPSIKKLLAIPDNDHSSLAKIDVYDFQTSYKRSIYLLRIAAGIAIAEAAVIIMLLTSFNALLPLKTTKFVFLDIKSNESKIYEIKPINTRMEGFKLFLEQKAEEFVHDMLSIDSVTQGERLYSAIRFAHPDYAKKFTKERIKSGAIQDVMDAGITRNIKIIAVDHIRTFKIGTYKIAVDFDQIDTKAGREIESKALRAYLSITTLPQTVSDAEKYENPLGIRIIDMAVKFRGTKNENK